MSLDEKWLDEAIKFAEMNYQNALRTYEKAQQTGETYLIEMAQIGLTSALSGFNTLLLVRNNQKEQK